jgi:hypothetical protein
MLHRYAFACAFCSDVHNGPSVVIGMNRYERWRLFEPFWLIDHASDACHDMFCVLLGAQDLNAV